MGVAEVTLGKEVAVQVLMVATEVGPSEGGGGDSVATCVMWKGAGPSLGHLRLCRCPGEGAVLSEFVAQRDPCLSCSVALTGT